MLFNVSYNLHQALLVTIQKASLNKTAQLSLSDSSERKSYSVPFIDSNPSVPREVRSGKSGSFMVTTRKKKRIYRCGFISQKINELEANKVTAHELSSDTYHIYGKRCHNSQESYGRTQVENSWKVKSNVQNCTKGEDLRNLLMYTNILFMVLLANFNSKIAGRMCGITCPSKIQEPLSSWRENEALSMCYLWKIQVPSQHDESQPSNVIVTTLNKF